MRREGYKEGVKQRKGKSFIRSIGAKGAIGESA